MSGRHAAGARDTGLVIACALLAATLALLVIATPAAAEPGDLSPTWEAEIQSAQSNLESEQQSLQEARAELEEAQAEGDSSFAESRQERVQYYEERVAGARAQIVAAESGLRKQNELDERGEPQDQLREIRESIAYYEVLRDEASAAGDSATVDIAQDELQGGTFRNGLYEQEEKAAAEREAKEAVGAETTRPGSTAETTGAESTESTSGSPPPDPSGGGSAGSGGDPGDGGGAGDGGGNEDSGSDTEGGPLAGLQEAFSGFSLVSFLAAGLIIIGVAYYLAGLVREGLGERAKRIGASQQARASKPKSKPRQPRPKGRPEADTGERRAADGEPAGDEREAPERPEQKSPGKPRGDSSTKTEEPDDGSAIADRMRRMQEEESAGEQPPESSSGTTAEDLEGLFWREEGDDEEGR